MQPMSISWPNHFMRPIALRRHCTQRFGEETSVQSSHQHYDTCSSFQTLLLGIVVAFMYSVATHLGDYRMRIAFSLLLIFFVSSVAIQGQNPNKDRCFPLPSSIPDHRPVPLFLPPASTSIATTSSPCSIGSAQTTGVTCPGRSSSPNPLPASPCRHRSTELLFHHRSVATRHRRLSSARASQLTHHHKYRAGARSQSSTPPVSPPHLPHAGVLPSPAQIRLSLGLSLI